MKESLETNEISSYKKILRKKYKKPTVNIINTEKINGLYSHSGADGAG